MPSSSQVVPVGEDGEPLDEKSYKVLAMLPWNLEARIAAVLACIKIPFILFVAYVGLRAENHLKTMTKVSWYREGSGTMDGIWSLLMTAKTGCYAHLMYDHLPHHNLISIGVEDTGMLSNATFDPLNLGNPDTCEVNQRTCKVRGQPHPGYFTGGIDHMVSFSLLWLVYKIIFIGLHPVDRLALKIAGDPEPGPNYPEPLMKLLTEPYFQKCTMVMQVLVKFLFYFRYKMMPNALLGALASMHDMRPWCPKVVYYKFSPVYGNLCYFMCVLDILSLFGAYAYVKFKMDGKVIGKNRYRGWKTGWLISASIWAFVAVWASFRTFGGLFQIVKAVFTAMFTIFFRFSLTFKLNLDMLRILTYAIFFFEGLELFSFIAIIVGPRVAPKLFAKLKEKGWIDDGPTNPLAPGAAYQPVKETGSSGSSRA